MSNQTAIELIRQDSVLADHLAWADANSIETLRATPLVPKVKKAVKKEKVGGSKWN